YYQLILLLLFYLSLVIFSLLYFLLSFFFFNDTPTTEIYTLSLHDALPILGGVSTASGNMDFPSLPGRSIRRRTAMSPDASLRFRSEEHTSELQSRENLVCRLLLEKKKKKKKNKKIKKI